MVCLEEDRALLDGYRQGDPEVLEQLYRAYAPEVARLLRRGFSFRSGGRSCRFHGVRSAFDLEDRVQEVFARVLSARARLDYDGLTPFGTYVRSVARNLVIDEFRRQTTALRAFSPEPPWPEADDGAEAESEPLLGLAEPTGRPDLDRGRTEVLELVEAFRASLSERDRRVYELRFERELDHAAVEARSGLSPSKIKTSEKRIRTAFFRYMRRNGYFQGYEQERRGWLRLSRTR